MHKRHELNRKARVSKTDSDSLVDYHGKNRRTRRKYVPVVRPVNDRSREALDYSTHHIAHKSSRYDEEVA